jgi:hypothetical protein
MLNVLLVGQTEWHQLFVLAHLCFFDENDPNTQVFGL